MSRPIYNSSMNYGCNLLNVQISIHSDGDIFINKYIGNGYYTSFYIAEILKKLL